MYRYSRVLFLLVLMFSVKANANVDDLLSNLAQKEDLSKKTKQESLGHLSVYTRQDLERLQIRSLRELVDRISFSRYNEDSSGSSSPFYRDYQASRSNFLRIFINGRELVSPLYGSALQLYGNMNMGYIDHVEIYAGIPSYRFGNETAVSVIRLYTKDPKREDTNLIGMLGGTYGTTDVYGYSAHSNEDLSYLLHVNQRNLNRKKIYHNGVKLKRDMENVGAFAQINVKEHSFEFQAIKGQKDIFLGNSLSATPDKPDAKYNAYSGGWYYNSYDNNIDASFNFTTFNTEVYEKAYDYLGFLNGAPYTSSNIKSKEELSDIHFAKTFEFENASLLLGSRIRYKKFDISDIYIDGQKINLSQNYDRDLIFSASIEGSYSIDDKNLLVISSKYDNYQRNGYVKDENILGARLGYVYNNEGFTSKNYLFYGEFAPESYLLTENYLAGATKSLKKEKALAISTEFIVRHGKHVTSLGLGRTRYYDSIIRNPHTFKYENLNTLFQYDTIQLKNIYEIDFMNRLDVNIWIHDKKNTSEDFHKTYLGGHVQLLNTFGKWDVANSLVFYGLDYVYENGGPAYNYNLALTYRHSRELSFFLKGSNLFGDAIKTSYRRLLGTVPNVAITDRTVWFGVEYQF